MTPTTLIACLEQDRAEISGEITEDNMLAPWNTPPNFLGAIEAGSQAGLAARREDVAQGQAADRLRLAYDQLASEEAQRNEAMQARMQAQTAANMLRSRNIDMLTQWHQAQTDRQSAADAALKDYRTQNLAQKLSMASRPTVHFGTEGEVMQRDPSTGELTEVKPPRAKPAKQPTVRVPVDPADPEKGTITGTMDDPEIAKRLNPPVVPKAPGLFDRLFHRGTPAARRDRRQINPR